MIKYSNYTEYRYKYKTGLIQNNFKIIVLIRESIDFQLSLGIFKAERNQLQVKDENNG